MGAREERLRRRLRDLGFDEVRFVRLTPGAGGAGLRAWLDAGYHADMKWMERTAAKRLDPGLVLDRARSALLLGGDVGKGGGRGEAAGPRAGPGRRALGDPRRGRLSRGRRREGRGGRGSRPRNPRVGPLQPVPGLP